MIGTNSTGNKVAVDGSGSIWNVAGSNLYIAFVGTDTVDKLFIGTTEMGSGIYGATGSGATTISYSFTPNSPAANFARLKITQN